MNVFQSFYEDADVGSAVGEITSSCFHFELMVLCHERFIFSLMDFHEAQHIGVDISVAKF